MISVIISTLDSERWLPASLAALIPAAVDGLVREVIIADRGSVDNTLAIADMTGAEIVTAPSSRALGLIAGAAAAKSAWLMFLPAAGVLTSGWEREAAAHMSGAGGGNGTVRTAAVFESALEGGSVSVRLLERADRAAHGALGLKRSGGLLIAREHYAGIGGYRPLAEFEDQDILRRIGRQGLRRMRSKLSIAADLRGKDARRSLGGIGRLALYRIGGMATGGRGSTASVDAAAR